MIVLIASRDRYLLLELENCVEKSQIKLIPLTDTVYTTTLQKLNNKIFDFDFLNRVDVITKCSF